MVEDPLELGDHKIPINMVSVLSGCGTVGTFIHISKVLRTARNSASFVSSLKAGDVNKFQD